MRIFIRRIYIAQPISSRSFASLLTPDKLVARFAAHSRRAANQIDSILSSLRYEVASACKTSSCRRLQNYSLAPFKKTAGISHWYGVTLIRPAYYGRQPLLLVLLSRFRRSGTVLTQLNLSYNSQPFQALKPILLVQFQGVFADVPLNEGS